MADWIAHTDTGVGWVDCISIHPLLHVSQRTLEASDRLVGLSDCGVERGEAGEGRHHRLRLAELLVQLDRRGVGVGKGGCT